MIEEGIEETKDLGWDCMDSANEEIDKTISQEEQSNTEENNVLEDSFDDLDFIKYEDIKKLLNSKTSIGFKIKLIDSYSSLKSRKWLNVEETEKEISEINPHTIPDYDDNFSVEIYELKKLISDVDQDKARLFEIYRRANADWKAIDELYEKILNQWPSYSTQKSDKKRESEAEDVAYFLFNERRRRRELFDYAKAKWDQLISKEQSISRKITASQELIKFYHGSSFEYQSEGKYRHNPSENDKIDLGGKKIKSWEDFK